MSRVMREMWHCDLCGWEWMPDSSAKPARCPSRACRSRKWDRLKRGGEMADATPKCEGMDHPSHAGSIPAPATKCTQSGHTGFQRADGYWCSTCRKMY